MSTCWICACPLPKRTWRICGACYQARYVVAGWKMLKRRPSV
jgi:hypothetical protein